MAFKTTLLATTLLGAVAAASGTAVAQTSPAASQAQLDALNRQIQALQSQIQSLKEEVKKEVGAVNKKVTDAPSVSVDGGRLRVRSADRSFDMAIRSRLHLDYGWWFPEENLGQDLADGFQVRRAFFGVNGVMFKDWGYEFTANFAGNRGGANEIQAANITYRGIKDWVFIAGITQPKFTLDDSTSSNDIPFMERSGVVNTVVGIGGSDARTAIGFTTTGPKHTVSAYLTGNRSGSTGQVDDQANVLGRAAFLAVDNTQLTVNVGASAVYQFEPQSAARTAANQATTSISFGDRPGVRIGGNSPSLTGTGSINSIDSAYGYGVDLGVSFRSFWAASEYYVFGANTKDTLATGARNTFVDPEFDGYYISAGYILTGERRKLSPGEFGGVRPSWPVGQNGAGAWEIAVRYGSMDLTDRSGGVAGSGTGQEDIWTFGVNWYVNAGIRFMANYIIADVERPNGTETGADALALRMQVQF